MYIYIYICIYIYIYVYLLYTAFAVCGHFIFFTLILQELLLDHRRKPEYPEPAKQKHFSRVIVSVLAYTGQDRDPKEVIFFKSQLATKFIVYNDDHADF